MKACSRLPAIASLVLALFWPVFASAVSPDECFQVTDVIRGSECGNPESVKLKCRNTCDQPLDIKACVERTNGRWDCGVSFAVKPSSDRACAGIWVCAGTGKYKLFGRTATSSVSFPDDSGTFRRAGDKTYSVATGETQDSACKRAQSVASAQSNCECEPLNSKGDFRCRVETQLAASTPPDKVKSFRSSEFQGIGQAPGGAPPDGARMAPVFSTAAGNTRETACSTVRNLAGSNSASCDCARNGTVWLCHASTMEPIPAGSVLDEAGQKRFEELKTRCLRDPETCPKGKTNSWGVRG